MSDVSASVTTFVLNRKIDEVERKKKDFCGFVTNTPFNAKNWSWEENTKYWWFSSENRL